MIEYLGVMPNFLLYRRDEEINANTLSMSEIKLVKMYRQMQLKQKEYLMCTVTLLEDEKYNLKIESGGDFIVEVEDYRKPTLLEEPTRH